MLLAPFSAKNIVLRIGFFFSSRIPKFGQKLTLCVCIFLFSVQSGNVTFQGLMDWLEESLGPGTSRMGGKGLGEWGMREA